MMSESDEVLDRRGKDHVCFARAKVYGAGGPICIWVHFQSEEELDDLIRLLTDLRDNPAAQREHIHLQDEGYRSLQPWIGDDASHEGLTIGSAEVAFYAPSYEVTWEDEECLRRAENELRKLRDGDV